MLRAIVACGWYGIQTWLGGSAIYTLLNILTGNAPAMARRLPLLDISVGQLACFLAFWALQIYFIVHGTDSIRWLESWSAPIKIVMCIALVWWATSKAGGLGSMLVRAVAVRAGRQERRHVLGDILAGPHRDGRLLGDARAEHSRLHALREDAARSDDRPVDRLACADGACCR